MTQKVSDKSAVIGGPPIVVKSEVVSRKFVAQPSADSTNVSVPGAGDDAPGELCVAFLGAVHKQKLFNKLVAACHRFENHVQYKDTYYLGFNVAGKEFTIELMDLGLAHTGAREMAIRNADAVILCYASHDAESFYRLASLSKDFDCRRQGAGNFPPTLLICDEDEELVEKTEDQISSSSEGYESASGSPPPSCKPPRRRTSMKRIELSNENPLPITYEQGQNMANFFGPQCEFISISISKFDDSKRLIDDLVQKIQSSNSSSTSSTKRKTSRPDLRTAITARLRRRRGSMSNESAKSSVVESESAGPSSDTTPATPLMPFQRVRQFAAFHSIPPIFRRRKVGKLPPAAASIPTPAAEVADGELTIIESGGVTKIHIFDSSQLACQRSRSALDLNAPHEGGDSHRSDGTSHSQPATPQLRRQKRVDSPLSSPPPAASTTPEIVIVVGEPSKVPAPRCGSKNASSPSAVCTIS